VRERIAAAAKRSARSANDVTLIAVSKTHPGEAIRAAFELGVKSFGENRVQEWESKRIVLEDLAGDWHLIGHLQSNKAAKAAELFSAVDSVDSVRVAERLNAAAEKAAKTLPILIEVNVGGEEAKTGASPESEELEKILLDATGWGNLSVRGLMTVPPYSDDPEGARPFFRQLRAIRDQIASRRLPAMAMDLLSMGMSHDFEVAIEEGSTCVRVGTAIFGDRAKP